MSMYRLFSFSLHSLWPGRQRLGAERPRGELPLRGGHRGVLPGQEQPEPDRAGPPSGGGRLRVLQPALPRHPLLRAQLLRPVRQRRRRHVRQGGPHVLILDSAGERDRERTKIILFVF